MSKITNALCLGRRAMLGGAIAASLPVPRARAQGASLKIAVLTDMSGPFRDITGPSSVACVHQALEDFGVAGKAMKVEVLVGDHQNKPDIGASVARQWFDRDGVDCVVDVPNSAVALAIQQVAREKNKVYLNASLATNRLTGDLCSPNMLHWTGDTHMLARSTGGAMMAAGDKDWFLLIANYALGHQLEANMNAMAAKGLGRISGRATYPFLETTDFSSFLLQAQSSGAKVLGLANVGQEARNAIKQAAEFGLTRTMKIAGLLMFIQDIHALGLQAAQGLHLTETFYWDLNDKTRAFTKRVQPKINGGYPNMEHAGCYASVLHYLKAASAMGIAEAKRDGVATVNRLKAMPFEDDCFGKGTIRADGRVLVTPHLFQVKTMAESKGPWDYYKLVSSLPPDQAFIPLAEGNCPLVR